MTADVRGKVLRTISGNIERSTRFYNWGALMRDLGWPQAGPWRQGVDRHELSLSALMERNAAFMSRKFRNFLMSDVIEAEQSVFPKVKAGGPAMGRNGGGDDEYP